MSFAALELADPLLKAIDTQGYTEPSPIQAQAIPAIIQGQDVMAAAQTGTGKTAAFTLPLLQRLMAGKPAASNQVRALVLCPTRELAAQVGDSVRLYGQNTSLRSAVVYGGVKINPQMMALRKGADILIATPGRLIDLYNQNAVKFNQLEILVLDEADRMLDMGFIHDIRKILALLPAKRQNLMFSATFSDEIRKLARGLVNNPVEVSVAAANSTADRVEQSLTPVDKKQKAALLMHLIEQHGWSQILVFTRTKHGANKLTRQLEEIGLKAAAIHGNKSQGARTKALEGFRNGKIGILVATDIAARGLDIDQLPLVVNFDLPNVAEDYVHRIGRTGRAGASGEAVSLVSADEFDQLTAIERLIGKKVRRVEVEEFEPLHRLPESKASAKPPRRKKKPKAHAPKPEHHDGQRPPTRQKRRPQRSNSAKPGSSGKSAQGGKPTNSAKPAASAAPKAQQKRKPKPKPNPWSKK